MSHQILQLGSDEDIRFHDIDRRQQRQVPGTLASAGGHCHENALSGKLFRDRGADETAATDQQHFIDNHVALLR